MVWGNRFNMQKYIVLLFLSIASIIKISAGDIHQVEGNSTYKSSEGESLLEAKNKALQLAIEDALAREFGKNIISIKTMTQDIKNGESKSDLTSLSSSEVKGEWLEIIGDPIYGVGLDGELYVVKVKVKGLARKISPERIDDIVTHVLRNGIQDSAEDDHFNAGDNMYVSFKTPVNGYITIYYVDKDKNVYRLLPYTYRDEASIKVKAGQRYVFFNRDHNTLDGIASHEVMEYSMDCEDEIESNMLYVVFSPNKFSKAMDSNDGYNVPNSLTFKDFQKWLTDRRKNDKMMNVYHTKKSCQKRSP